MFFQNILKSGELWAFSTQKLKSYFSGQKNAKIPAPPLPRHPQKRKKSSVDDIPCLLGKFLHV
jgi:hypothetical protein